MNNFASKIKQLRTKRKLSQEELGKSVGVDQSTVAHWERKGNIPEFPTIMRICQKYNIPIGDLMSSDKLPDKDVLLEENKQLKKQVALLEELVGHLRKNQKK